MQLEVVTQLDLARSSCISACMKRNIVPLQRETASQVFNTEWTYQLASLEQSLQFLEEYCLWVTQQFNYGQKPPYQSVSKELLQFYQTETPMILEDAKEALQVLRMITRTDQV